MTSLAPPPPKRPERLITRRRAAAVLLPFAFVLVALAAKRLPDAFADEERLGAPAVPRSPTPAEARWIAQAAGYVTWLVDARVDPTTVALRLCEEQFDAQVGDAPGERLAELQTVVEMSCRKLNQGARLAITGRTSFSAEKTGEGQVASVEGARLLQLARAAVRPHAVSVAGSRVNRRFSSVASRLMGHEVTVRCWRARPWREIVERGAIRDEFQGLAGVAGFEQQTIHLAPSICTWLERVGSRRPPHGNDVLDAAFAVGALSHEAHHLAYSGPSSEAGVECHGMQRIRRTARLLGAPSDYSARLAIIYLALVYPHNLPRYRSPECRDGGALDLRPKSSGWP